MPQYQLLTTGEVGLPPTGWKGEFEEKWEDHLPKTPDYDPSYCFEARLNRPLVSAYRKHWAVEPDFTNNVISSRDGKPEEKFVATLDYIFCSDSVDVVEAQELPHRDAVAGKGPLPWDTEPSDHLMLCATIRV